MTLTDRLQRLSCAARRGIRQMVELDYRVAQVEDVALADRVSWLNAEAHRRTDKKAGGIDFRSVIEASATTLRAHSCSARSTSIVRRTLGWWGSRTRCRPVALWCTPARVLSVPTTSAAHHSATHSWPSCSNGPPHGGSIFSTLVVLRRPMRPITHWRASLSSSVSSAAPMRRWHRISAATSDPRVPPCCAPSNCRLVS